RNGFGATNREMRRQVPKNWPKATDCLSSVAPHHSLRTRYDDSHAGGALNPSAGRAALAFPDGHWARGAGEGAAVGRPVRESVEPGGVLEKAAGVQADVPGLLGVREVDVRNQFGEASGVEVEEAGGLERARGWSDAGFDGDAHAWTPEVVGGE